MVCRDFILTEIANRAHFYAFFNLRNLFYLIKLQLNYTIIFQVINWIYKKQQPQSFKLGGCCLYTCQIRGQESYLWLEKGRWLLAAKG